MSQPAAEFVDRLAAIPDQRVLLTRQPIEYPEEVVSALPADMIWPIWWTRVIGPEPVMALLYLHHLAGNGTHQVKLDEVARVFTPPDDPMDLETSLSVFHWALTRCAMHRLVGLATAETRVGFQSVLLIPSRIPRPGRGGFDAITESFEKLTMEFPHGR